MSFTTHFSIVNGIKNEQDPSWNRFFETYEPLIRLHGKDCGIPADSIDDLIQNVMLSVYKQMETFVYDPKRGRFRDYLRFIIRARANDMLRAFYKAEKIREIELSEEYLDDLFSTEWEEHIKTESLKKLKATSSTQHYQLFHMLEIQNRDVKEVADFFNLPKATVYSIRKRMEEKLRQIAKELDI